MQKYHEWLGITLRERQACMMIRGRFHETQAGYFQR